MALRPVPVLPLALLLTLPLAACADPETAPPPERAAPARAIPMRGSPPVVRRLPEPAPPRGATRPAATLPAFTAELRLEHGSHATPAGAPTVVVHGPLGLPAGRPLHLVLFLHGWRGCARVLAADGQIACREGGSARRGWGLSTLHDAAGSATVLVVPQLAWLTRDGSPGRFAQPGFAEAWLDELAEALREELGGARPDIGSVTLVAHSAGYETALAFLAQAERVPIRNVVLMDALYGGTEDFAAWALADDGRRLMSLHTDQRSTSRESAALARLCSEQMGAEAVSNEDAGSIGEAVLTHRVVVRRSPWGHGAIPSRQLEEVLRALPLPARP